MVIRKVFYFQLMRIFSNIKDRPLQEGFPCHRIHRDKMPAGRISV